MDQINDRKAELDALIASVEGRKDELVDLLSDLVRFETPTPPARNTVPAQNHVQALLEDMGFDIDRWDVYPNDPVVVSTRKGTDSDSHKSLILNGHMDVAKRTRTKTGKPAPSILSCATAG